MQASPHATSQDRKDAALNDAVEAVLAAALEADWAKPRARIGPLLAILLTGALALCFAVMQTAESAGNGSDAAPLLVPVLLPVPASLPAPDTAVPVARRSADSVVDALPATF